MIFQVVLIITAHLILIGQPQSTVSCYRQVSEFDSKYDSAARLKAYIHVGPTKTGTTDIQANLHVAAHDLNKSGFRQPTFESGIGIAFQNALMDELSGRTSSHNFESFVKKCVAEQKHIVLSAESLQTATPAIVTSLKRILHNYDVTIIMFFRDMLARIISNYGMFLGHEIYSWKTLPSFTTYAYEELPSKYNITVHGMIDGWCKAYGSENVVVVDYNGVIAAGLDASYVIQCEIMGVRCEETAKLNQGGNMHHRNTKHTDHVIHRMVFNYAEAYAKEWCHDCGCISKQARTALLDIVERECNHLPIGKLSLPMRNIDLGPLMNYSLSIEAHVRGDARLRRWYYPDPAASARARAQLHVEELDVYTLHNDPLWIDWLHNLLYKLKLETYLCA